MLENKQPFIQDFFSFLKNDLLEVLECLSNEEPWQDHMMGYELPVHSEESECKEWIIIFMNSFTYYEITIKSIDFYDCLKETCLEFIEENPEQKKQVDLLIDTIAVVLNL
ncbi:hypothetical protein HOO54_17145 [Bacillus sp. WMMC1349]|uniref:hypothetical protein n=1 Tax=Bacillus sp. WMMC1349 TaxID=2736254 RepID=UPI001554AD73|nr:hypothetical protein [Bacillus sp. WMMC1349]NPC93894.1 hypothetical protein [Bacillus sp. WMMC1349]